MDVKPLSPIEEIAARPAPTGTEMLERIGAVGRRVREPLKRAVVEVAGPQPRPARLVQVLDLDKSLASRIVRAIKADTDHEFVHSVPSPAGLSILLQRGTRYLSPAVRMDLENAIRELQRFVDETPGGRDLIDAHIADSLGPARVRQEKLARQAAFRSMSFLLGHTCESLETSLFLLPSMSGSAVDAIEVVHRVGLRRLRPSRPLALLRVHAKPEGALPEDAAWIEPLQESGEKESPLDYLLADFTRPEISHLSVQVAGSVATISLPGDPDSPGVQEIASAWRIRNGLPRVPASASQALRVYLLHSPCRRLVRSIYVHESLYSGASVHVGFRVPAPSGSAAADDSLGPGALDRVELYSFVEQLPRHSLSQEMREMGRAHGAVIRRVVDQIGLDTSAFRGWRCVMQYPVPLVEMVWWASFPTRT